MYCFVNAIYLNTFQHLHIVTLTSEKEYFYFHHILFRHKYLYLLSTSYKMLWPWCCCVVSALFAQDLTDDGSLEPLVWTSSDTTSKQSPFGEPQSLNPTVQIKATTLLLFFCHREKIPRCSSAFSLVFVPFLMKRPPLPAASVLILLRRQPKAPLTPFSYPIFFCGFFLW